MIRLLIIDDNPQDRLLAHHALTREMADLAITEVGDAATFDRALEVADYAAVITDYHLQWSDGLTVLRAVKERDPLCPVVMFTGSGNEEIAVEAMKAGLDDYVVKSPRHYGRLPAALRTALQRAELQRRTTHLEAERDELLIREQAARQAAEQAAERTNQLQAVTEALALAVTPEDVAQVIIQQGIRVLGARAGSLALLNHERAEMTIVKSIGYAEALITQYRTFPLDVDLPMTRAVRTGEPVWLRTRADFEEQYPNLTRDPSHQDHAWAAIPLCINDLTLGVIGMNFVEERRFDQDDQTFMLTVAQQCAQVLDRSRLYENEQNLRAQAEINRQRQTFLANVSAMLAETLDYEQTLDNIARMSVPTVADYCVVHLCNEQNEIQPVAVAHTDPAKRQLVYALERRYPRTMSKGGIVLQAIRSGESQLVEQINEQALREGVQEDAHLQIVLEINPHSLICVPLNVRGEHIGTLTLTTSESRRSYTSEDVFLAEELARRAALAINQAQLYRAAQEAIKMRDTFLSIASHELKTPLTSLLGYTEILQRRLAKNDTISERDHHALNVIWEQGLRLEALIKALLDISRIQSGQLSIERTPLNLYALVQKVVDEVRPTLDKHTIVIEPIAQEQLTIQGDAIRLEQVFQNLLSNAIKYSPEGGTVTVRCLLDGGQARVAVTDEGVGIPEAVRDRIFQRFYRERTTKTRHVSGVGIGLYIVKEIVTLHGGTVAIESTLGQGSTFTVSLPVDERRDA